MALEAVVNQISSFFTVDTVAIYDQNFNQIFAKARPLKVAVKEEAKLMEHPLEDGSTITDHRIVLPEGIELSLLIRANDFDDVYQQIKKTYLASTLLTVVTKTGTYENQIIESLPHEENPDTFDTITLALKLKHVEFSTPETSEYSPRKSSNKSTKDKGTQQGKEVSEKRKSVIKQALS